MRVNNSLDNCIRLYDTSSSRTFNRLAEIEVDDVGWSILDTALSPDRTSVAYSTWSDCSKLKSDTKFYIFLFLLI